jgi:hypothetical protein
LCTSFVLLIKDDSPPVAQARAHAIETISWTVSSFSHLASNLLGLASTTLNRAPDASVSMIRVCGLTSTFHYLTVPLLGTAHSTGCL